MVGKCLAVKGSGVRVPSAPPYDLRKRSLGLPKALTLVSRISHHDPHHGVPRWCAGRWLVSVGMAATPRSDASLGGWWGVPRRPVYGTRLLAACLPASPGVPGYATGRERRSGRVE